jgi:hypothetical protein
VESWSRLVNFNRVSVAERFTAIQACSDRPGTTARRWGDASDDLEGCGAQFVPQYGVLESSYCVGTEALRVFREHRAGYCIVYPVDCGLYLYLASWLVIGN